MLALLASFCVQMGAVWIVSHPEVGFRRWRRWFERLTIDAQLSETDGMRLVTELQATARRQVYLDEVRWELKDLTVGGDANGLTFDYDELAWGYSPVRRLLYPGESIEITGDLDLRKPWRDRPDEPHLTVTLWLSAPAEYSPRRSVRMTRVLGNTRTPSRQMGSVLK
jgi:hypothetical protein